LALKRELYSQRFTATSPASMLRIGNLPRMVGSSLHSGEDVIVTAAGPGSERVRGQIENTEVFRIMAEALGLGYRP
jgi:alkaline phosphatase